MSTLVAQTISNGTVSTSSANVIQGSAKAWVNFNGTTSPGTIRASYNVSSITKTGTGTYTANITNALQDANYVAVVSAGDNNGLYTIGASSSNTTTSCFLISRNGPSNALTDVSFYFLAIFR